MKPKKQKLIKMILFLCIALIVLLGSIYLCEKCFGKYFEPEETENTIRRPAAKFSKTKKVIQSTASLVSEQEQEKTEKEESVRSKPRASQPAKISKTLKTVRFTKPEKSTSEPSYLYALGKKFWDKFIKPYYKKFEWWKKWLKRKTFK